MIHKIDSLKDDWRYDLGYSMKDSTFTHKKYKPLNPENDHDHCEFCTTKFSQNIEGALKVGYQTIYNRKYKGEIRTQDAWVCSECFEDFQEVLNLRVEESD